MNFQLSTWRSTDDLPFPPVYEFYSLPPSSPFVGLHYFVGKVIILIIRERVLFSSKRSNARHIRSRILEINIIAYKDYLLI